MNRYQAISAEVPLILRYTSLDSTMQEARRIIDAVPQLTDCFLVIADTQTSGKGRSNHSWSSPQGGLWFTYAMRQTADNRFSLLVGWMLHQTLTDMFPLLNEGLRIKWTNDLYYNDSKLAGILIEQHKDYLLCGIGINTNTDSKSFTGIDGFSPISLKQVMGMDISHTAFLTVFIHRLNHLLASSQGIRWESVIESLNRHLYALNKAVRLDMDNYFVTGICRGIDITGGIIIQSDSISVHYAGSLHLAHSTEE